MVVFPSSELSSSLHTMQSTHNPSPPNNNNNNDNSNNKKNDVNPPQQQTKKTAPPQAPSPPSPPAPSPFQFSLSDLAPIPPFRRRPPFNDNHHHKNHPTQEAAEQKKQETWVTRQRCVRFVDEIECNNNNNTDPQSASLSLSPSPQSRQRQQQELCQIHLIPTCWEFDDATLDALYYPTPQFELWKVQGKSQAQRIRCGGATTTTAPVDTAYPKAQLLCRTGVSTTTTTSFSTTSVSSSSSRSSTTSLVSSSSSSSCLQQSQQQSRKNHNSNQHHHHHHHHHHHFAQWCQRKQTARGLEHWVSRIYSKSKLELKATVKRIVLFSQQQQQQQQQQSQQHPQQPSQPQSKPGDAEAEFERLKSASENYVPMANRTAPRDNDAGDNSTNPLVGTTTTAPAQQRQLGESSIAQVASVFAMNNGNNNNGNNDGVAQQQQQLIPQPILVQQQPQQQSKDSQQQQQQPFFVSTNAAMIPTAMPMMAPFQFAPPAMLQQAGVLAQTAVAAPSPFDGTSAVSHEQLEMMQQKNAEDMKKRKRRRKSGEVAETRITNNGNSKRKGKLRYSKKPPPSPPQDVPQENFSWEHRVENLKYFKNHFGDCLVPKHYITQEGFKLGQWVSRLRRRYFRLDDKLVETFDQLGFRWKLKGTRVGLKWTERLALLQQYKEIHGNVDVDRKYVDEKTGFELGRFVQSLKFDDDPAFTEEQRNDLDRLGFDILGPQPKNSNWRKQKSNDDKWEKQFQLLLEYRKENPNLWPGTKNKYRGARLGAWVKIQREEYKMAQGAFPPLRGKTRIKRRRCLPQDRIDRLNSIGFAWNLKAPRRTVRDYQLIPSTHALKPDMNINEAMDFLNEHKLSECAVLNDKQNNEFIGYVRLLDIIQKHALAAPNFNLSARADEVNQRYIHAAKCMAQIPSVVHIMIPRSELITVTPSTPLSKVAALLARDHIQKVAVVDDEEKTRGALLGYMDASHVVQDFRLLVRNLPTAPIVRKRKTYEEEDDAGPLGDEEEMIFRNGDHDMLGIGDDDDEDDMSSDEE